jgi:hypothetical protein
MWTKSCKGAVEGNGCQRNLRHNDKTLEVTCCCCYCCCCCQGPLSWVQQFVERVQQQQRRILLLLPPQQQQPCWSHALETRAADAEEAAKNMIGEMPEFRSSQNTLCMNTYVQSKLHITCSRGPNSSSAILPIGPALSAVCGGSCP